jgi:ArsR family transcriptional regulator
MRKMTRINNKASALKGKDGLSDRQFAAISKALADPRRFAILRQAAALQANALPCADLEEHGVISAATISHHIKKLADAGLIRVEREGRFGSLVMERPVWNAYLRRLSSL